MEIFTRNQIQSKANDIAKLISEEEEVKLFQRAEKQISNHKVIQELISNIKIKQQELVNAKHYKKPRYIEQLERELDSLNRELHEIPLVRQYQQTQTEINKDIQEIIGIINLEINKSIPLDKD